MCTVAHESIYRRKFLRINRVSPRKLLKILLKLYRDTTIRIMSVKFETDLKSHADSVN